jgi:hypothetical protein
MHVNEMQKEELMIGTKLAVLAGSIAGAAVLSWTVYEGLRDDSDAPRTADEAAADSPIARLVARGTAPERTPSGWEAWSSGREGWSSGWSSGWEPWSRAAAELRAMRWLAGSRDGEAYLDRARERAALRVARARALPMAAKREPLVSGRSYQPPRRAGAQVIVTSGHRIDSPRLRLPQTTSVNVALRGRSRVPVRVEVCVNEDGRPEGASVIEGTGVAAVDRYVVREMVTGRYRPVWRDGRPVRFCERTTIMLQTSEVLHVARPPSECGPDC